MSVIASALVNSSQPKQCSSVY